MRIEGTVAGVDDVEELALNGTTPVIGLKSFTEIREITKPLTTGRIAIRDVSVVELGTIAPWDQQGNYNGIRLVPIVDVSTTVNFLCTRRFQNLVSDDDSIILPKAEDGIISLLIGSLLKIKGDDQKAMIHQQEGFSSIKAAAFNENEINNKDWRALPGDGLFGDLGSEVDHVHVTDTSITGIGF